MISSSEPSSREPANGERIAALVILGSGMSGCYGEHEYDVLHDREERAVAGHFGKLVRLRNAAQPVLVSLGRRHLYEGWSQEEVAAVVRAAAGMGATRLVITNAAGGLNPGFATGDIMLIEGCLGMMMGRRGMPGTVLFGSGHRAHDPFAVEEYDAIRHAAAARGVALVRGVYVGVLGPNYETRAEIRMLRRMGADAVGMSTVLEANVARSLGMRVIGLSLITNTLSDTSGGGLDHEDVVRQGTLAAERMRRVLDAVLACA